MNRTFARALEVLTACAAVALVLWLPIDWHRALWLLLGTVALVRLISLYVK